MKKKTLVREEVENFKGYIRILPDPTYDKFNAFFKVKQIFSTLNGTKKGPLSMNKFTQLSKIKGMTTDKLLKPHYEIIFKRVT